MVNFQQFIRDRVSEDTNGCWVWQRYRDPCGYGRFGMVGTPHVLAHRLAYEAFVGAIPEGLHVCHRCDNPACCNPEHLFLGTHHDNMQDRSRKGRSASVLSPEQVQEIRSLHAEGVTQRQIALRFGVSFQQVSRIIRRERWGWVGDA